jgi:LDH2 family malate/lactate/ureidoglycolate dehydrogenase
MRNAIDDANQTGLASTIRAQQSINGSIGHFQIYMAQGNMIAIFLTDIGNFYK